MACGFCCVNFWLCRLLGDVLVVLGGLGGIIHSVWCFENRIFFRRYMD